MTSGPPPVTVRALGHLDALWTSIACVDDAGVLVAVNAAFAEMLGTTRQALEGHRLEDLVSRELNIPFFQGLDETRADGVRRRVRNGSGDLNRIFDNIFTRTGDLVIIEVADVSDEVREHDRRRQVESARDVIFGSVVEYFVVVDLVDREIVASPSVWDRWPIDQLQRALVTGQLDHPDPTKPRWDDPWPNPSALLDGRVERAIGEVFSTGAEQRHRTAVPLAEGRVRQFDTKLVPWTVDGERRGVVIIAHDQTDLLAHVDQRALAEEATGQLLAALPASIWEADLHSLSVRPLFEDRRTPAHPAWGRDVPLEEFLASWDPDSRVKVRSLVFGLEPNGRGSALVVSADGLHTAQVSVVDVPAAAFGHRRRALIVVTDLTRELAQAQADSRMDHAAQVMRFAQGVAHDFGNIAQVVGGFAQLLARSHEAPVVDAAAEHLASAARRAVEVSRRIAMIARVEKVTNAPLDVGQLVMDLKESLEGIVGDGILVTVDARPGAWCIAEHGQVASAVENLCANAASAMDARGRIWVSVSPSSKGPWDGLEIMVRDNGPGLPAGMIDNVFDAFVTGRPGVGSGLGLYLIREYMHSVRGQVKVDSTEDGATFTLWFPRLEPARTEYAP
jgi:PAS domain S-box-containing protein